MPAVLFLTVVVVWGLTWFAIHLQLGTTPDVVSIFWRFASASILLWMLLLATKSYRPGPWRRHIGYAGLGLCLFSVNFLFLYAAGRHISSGLESVVFSLATVLNVFNQFLFRRIRPSARVLIGAILGAGGVALLFADQLIGPHVDALGILLALGGTYSFSLGNLLSTRITADGTTLANAMVRAMSWGAACLGLLVIASGDHFAVSTNKFYLGGLAYLSIFGTIIGFFTYLTLVARIGPSRAAYVTVITPVVALTMSTFFEHYHWTGLAIPATILILLGNLIIFLPSRRRAVTHVSLVK
ncbi:MAG TPA: EamA family transporter [Acidiphilium sp.]|nr:MAG: hypothetical protein B7Z67_00720 [Acidiphilium sp. 21-60-14]OYV90566.1 MAG: hypothetical protein B7Z57_08040 [Acidiphilium sp. 37-60-79]OZB41491.1 MAG: hypothetical protein B7X48_00250 [Acidiphilium sp. 34-60-192]HQT87597.1 EamA family transporter [Acidiphilium sp.]HQU24172.1 EamA family transporter [Acidiphilium sp.]